METVTLYKADDFADFCGEFKSAGGASWAYDSADEIFPCDICGEEIDGGYQCLDGGDWICESHVTIVPAWIGRKLADENREFVESHSRLVQMRCIIGQAVRESFQAEHMPGKYLGWTQAKKDVS